MSQRACALLLPVMLSGVARADHAPPAPARAFDEPTARESDRAPPPGETSGRLDEVDEGDGAGRWLGRLVLLAPRLVFEAIWLPLYGTLYAFDHYHLDDLYYRVFYNNNRTLGLVPTATFVSGLGLSIGARFISSDTFGDKERFQVQATTGAISDPYRESALVEFTTGDRFGKVFALDLSGNFDRRPDDPFYGIGNGDDRETHGDTLVDPRTNDFAFAVHHRYQEARVALAAEIKPIKQLQFKLTGSLTELSYDPSTSGIPLDQVYDPMAIPGFEGGVEHAYAELAMRVDTRASSSKWEPDHMFTTGALLSGFAGRVHRLDEGKDFYRYGVDLQQFFHLGDGPRSLAVRLRGEAVSGSVADVPFTELPMLGGADFLRGYSFERFRDRVSAFGSLQYGWDVSHFVDAFLFTDVGRVYGAVEEISLDHLRCGFGLGIEIHGDHSFLTALTLASSIDGGLVTTLTFNPVVDARGRWR